MTKRIVPTGARYFLEPYREVNFHGFSGMISLPDGDYALNPSKGIYPDFMHPESILILANWEPTLRDDNEATDELMALIKERCPDAYRNYAERHYRKFPDAREKCEEVIRNSAMILYYWMCADPDERGVLIRPHADAGGSFVSHYTNNIKAPTHADRRRSIGLFGKYESDTMVTMFDGFVFHHYETSSDIND